MLRNEVSHLTAEKAKLHGIILVPLGLLGESL